MGAALDLRVLNLCALGLVWWDVSLVLVSRFGGLVGRFGCSGCCGARPGSGLVEFMFWCGFALSRVFRSYARRVQCGGMFVWVLFRGRVVLLTVLGVRGVLVRRVCGARPGSGLVELVFLGWVEAFWVPRFGWGLLWTCVC